MLQENDNLKDELETMKTKSTKSSEQTQIQLIIKERDTALKDLFL